MAKLRNLLFGVEEQTGAKASCKTCMYANKGECALGFPEAFTPEAYDCSAFILKT